MRQFVLGSVRYLGLKFNVHTGLFWLKKDTIPEIPFQSGYLLTFPPLLQQVLSCNGPFSLDPQGIQHEIETGQFCSSVFDW